MNAFIQMYYILDGWIIDVRYTRVYPKVSVLSR